MPHAGLVIVGVPTDATWNGLDVAHAIRRKAPALPVILIPGESSEERRDRRAARGRYGLSQAAPAALRELLASVRRCLEGETATACAGTFARDPPFLTHPT